MEKKIFSLKEWEKPLIELSLEEQKEIKGGVVILEDIVF